MAGLLTYSIRKRLPVICKITVVRVFASELFNGVHSSGSVRDLHPIPFYCNVLHKKQTNLLRRKDTCFFYIGNFRHVKRGDFKLSPRHCKHEG
jgi:hypothetical protein